MICIRLSIFIFLIVIQALLIFILINYLGIANTTGHGDRLLNESNYDVENTSCSPFHRQAQQLVGVELDGRLYPQVVPTHFNRSLNFDCLNRGPLKRIFYWTRFWWANTFDFGLGERTPFELHNCPVTNCEVTNDPTKLNSSDLVIMHAYNLMNRDKRAFKYPPSRPAGQRWVFTYFESPLSISDMCFKNLTNTFALLNTYHEKSDFNSIYHSNAHFEWKTNTSFDVNFDYHATKVSVVFLLYFQLFGSNEILV